MCMCMCVCVKSNSSEEKHRIVEAEGTMMMRTSKQGGAEKQRGGGVSVSGRVVTLHQRLYHALNLALRSTEDKEQKWSFPDIEIQRLVIRSIDAFLECISSETVQHSLVKDSVADIIGALNGILRSKSESILKLASDVTLKVVNVLRNSMLQLYVLDLVRSLSSLLSSRQAEVAVSCVTALDVILANLSTRRENEVWEILKETNAVGYLVQNVKDSFSGNKSFEYFTEMASLLSKIMRRWPPSRLCVWTDNKLFDDLKVFELKPDNSVKAAVLRLYSTLALCGNGARKLLENGEPLLQMMVGCMDKSNPHSVQLEAFKLAQCLMIGEQECSEVMKLCCEPLVKAIMSGMNLQSSNTAKLSKDQMSIVSEACRLALITRWAGDHHSYFWKAGIDRVLLGLILDNLHESYQHHSLQELIVIAQDGLRVEFLLPLRSFIWDILGWLATNSSQNVKPEIHCSESHFNILLICACLAFMDSVRIACQISQTDNAGILGSEPASRAVLMMVYSPCKYIASRVRLVLSEILRPNGKDHIKYLYDNLNAILSRNFARPSNLQVALSLMSLACYLGLPKYQKHVIRFQGIMTIVAFIRWWLSSPVPLKRASLAPHLQTLFSERTCCWPSAEDWEGENLLLVLGLWVLAEMLCHLGSVSDMFDNQKGFNRAQLIRELEEVCINNSSAGPRWYAAYVLSYLGMYGFPNKFGSKIQKALTENDYTDLELAFTNQESLYVHKVILMVRCPSLLPPGDALPKEKVSADCFMRQEEETKSRFVAKLEEETNSRFVAKLHVSAHVDHQSFLKLLQYIYLGYLQVDDEDSVNKLKFLSKRCSLQPLLHVLYRRNPKWGTPFPSLNLRPALESDRHQYSDVRLEAERNQLTHWECSNCASSTPHLHVHKVILGSTCEYLRALFQSGMQESQLQTVKVPISWTALVKLVGWMYSYELPMPISGCPWDNLDINDKTYELRPYIELCWLAEFWLLEDLYEECHGVIISCLDSCVDLSVKMIRVAADFNQWELAEVAATYMAPAFHQLRNSGELDTLGEDLTEMVRAASVRLAQESSHQSLFR